MPVRLKDWTLEDDDDSAPAAARYEALVRISEALRAWPDCHAWCRRLAIELEGAISLGCLGLALHDEDDHNLTFTVVDAAGAPLTPPTLSADDSLARWIVQHQEPLVLPVLDAETRFTRDVAYLRDHGMRSACALPLTTPSRRVGLLLAGSREPRAYGQDEVTFLSAVASHVALAIDNALNHDSLRHALASQADRSTSAQRLVSGNDPEERSARRYRGPVPSTAHRILGSSQEWQTVVNASIRVAATDTTVLLTGESGTGKEVVARFIHRASKRATGPFVAINCGALPEQLLESELFGHERGAFTGAQQAKPGRIEQAAGGVLFLDEVSEMSPSAQAKFLRVLQEREYQRLGSTRTSKANVRVIAATNRDLSQSMQRGTFRKDLFYRLHVFDIRLPPLRARTADILPMSEAFLVEIGRLLGRPPAALAPDAKAALLNHRWPGNVRELRNALERAAILCEDGPITAAHLSFNRGSSTAHTYERPSTTDLNAIERETIVHVLVDCQGNKSKAAERLGLSRTQLYVRLRRHKLSDACWEDA